MHHLVLEIETKEKDLARNTPLSIDSREYPVDPTITNLVLSEGSTLYLPELRRFFAYLVDDVFSKEADRHKEFREKLIERQAWGLEPSAEEILEELELAEKELPKLTGADGGQGLEHDKLAEKYRWLIHLLHEVAHTGEPVQKEPETALDHVPAKLLTLPKPLLPTFDGSENDALRYWLLVRELLTALAEATEQQRGLPFHNPSLGIAGATLHPQEVRELLNAWCDALKPEIAALVAKPSHPDIKIVWGELPAFASITITDKERSEPVSKADIECAKQWLENILNHVEEAFHKYAPPVAKTEAQAAEQEMDGGGEPVEDEDKKKKPEELAEELAAARKRAAELTADAVAFETQAQIIANLLSQQFLSLHGITEADLSALAQKLDSAQASALLDGLDVQFLPSYHWKHTISRGL
jgi:hypothetical protein